MLIYGFIIVWQVLRQRQLKKRDPNIFDILFIKKSTLTCILSFIARCLILRIEELKIIHYSTIIQVSKYVLHLTVI